LSLTSGRIVKVMLCLQIKRIIDKRYDGRVTKRYVNELAVAHKS
jgi:hypothetical protein